MSGRVETKRTHDHESFYKYVNSEVAQLILTRRALRWSSPLLYNDPFDMPRRVTVGVDEDELHRAVIEEIARLIEAGIVPPGPATSLLGPVLMMASRASADDRNALAEDLRRELGDGSLKREANFDTLHTFWENLLPRFRILCLSEVNNSTSMWAHYAAKHRGVVIELACRDDLDSAWLVARPVVYMDSPPRLASRERWVQFFTGQETLNYEELFKAYEYTKSTDWSYEKEWRVVTLALEGENGLFSDWHLHPLEIRAVYLGERTPVSDSTVILDLLQGDLAHVAAYRAISNPGTLRFRFDPM